MSLLAREDLAFALAVILLGLLMMITRRNAVTQIIGFMSLENGLVLAATGAKGMPLVVEFSVAFSILIVFIVFGVFVFRIRERFDTVDVSALDRFRGDRSDHLCIDPVHAILWIPAIAIPVLALMPNYRLGAALNVLASGLTFVAGVSLLFAARVRSDLLIVDDFNIFFVTVTTFVAFTTSIFSASYIGHELETGRLTPVFLRFYHALYQAMIGAMNVALVANNIGLMWVGLEVATLSTVMMVGIYRTPEAVEAAWKYFILGSVGIALAFFGTILVYLAAQDVLGEGLPAMAWDLMVAEGRELRSAAVVARLRVPAGRLRHQGRARAVPRLAARRACGRPDPDLGGAVGPSPQRRALRAAALQDPAGGEPGDAQCRDASWSCSASSASSSRRSCCTAAATSSACSPTRRSSTWGSSPSPSAWAGPWRTSPASCT